MSEARAHGESSPTDAENAELWQIYEKARDALERGDLPAFTSEEDFLRHAASRS